MLYLVIFDLTNSDEEKIIKLEDIPSYNMIEEGSLSDNILLSSSKEVQEKEDDLTLKGIPSRHNQPLTTSDIQEKEKICTTSPRVQEKFQKTESN